MKFKKLIGLMSLQILLTYSASAGELHVGQELQSQSGASIEVSRIQECSTEEDSGDAKNISSFKAMYLTEGMSCEDKQFFELNLSIVRITLAISAVGTACTGVATPIAIVLAGAAAGVEMVDIVVRNLECFDQRANERNRAQVQQAVCEAMANQGLECHLEH